MSPNHARSLNVGRSSPGIELGKAVTVICFSTLGPGSPLGLSEALAVNKTGSNPGGIQNNVGRETYTNYFFIFETKKERLINSC
jgi:hypothetical protein